MEQMFTDYLAMGWYKNIAPKVKGHNELRIADTVVEIVSLVKARGGVSLAIKAAKSQL